MQLSFAVSDGWKVDQLGAMAVKDKTFIGCSAADAPTDSCGAGAPCDFFETYGGLHLFSFLGQLNPEQIENTHIVGGMASSRLGYNYFCSGKTEGMNILSTSDPTASAVEKQKEFLTKSQGCIHRGAGEGMWVQFVNNFVKPNQELICEKWRPALESNVMRTAPMMGKGKFNSLERPADLHADSISPFEVLQHFAKKAIEDRPEADMERERAVEFMEVVGAIHKVCEKVAPAEPSEDSPFPDFIKDGSHPKNAFGCFAGSYLVALIEDLFGDCDTAVKDIIISGAEGEFRNVNGDWMDGYLKHTEDAVKRYESEKEKRPKESALADLERDLSTLSTMVIRA